MKQILLILMLIFLPICYGHALNSYPSLSEQYMNNPSFKTYVVPNEDQTRSELSTLGKRTTEYRAWHMANEEELEDKMQLMEKRTRNWHTYIKEDSEYEHFYGYNEEVYGGVRLYIFDMD